MTRFVLSGITTLAALAVLSLSTAGTGIAQSRTWLVDAAGGAGVDFSDLPPAVAAAAPGDVILVRSGDYLGFTTSKGVRILSVSSTGAATVRAPATSATHTIGVVGLPATETFAMVGILVYAPDGGGAGLELTSCSGTIHVERCTVETGPAFAIALQPALWATDSARIDLWYSTFLGYPAAFLDRCTVLAADARFLGVNGGNTGPVHPNYPGHGMAAIGSTVELSRCQLAGGSPQGIPYGRQPGSGLVSVASDWTIHSENGGSVVAGSASNLPVTAALGNGTIRFDGPSTFGPTGGGAETDPGIVTIPATLPTLTLIYAPVLGTMRIDLSGAAGDLFVLLFGVPSDPLPIPGLGDLLLDPNLGLIGMAAGTIDASRYVSPTFPIPSVPTLRGTRFGWQAVRSGPGGELALSNRASFVYR